MSPREPRRGRIAEIGLGLSGSAWFAYASILLLQLKRIWGIWNLRDLSHGDTSHYFIAAREWYEHFVPSLSFSPLYTVFYGSLLFLSSDVYLVTILHRIVILLALAALILAVMRRLLPAPLAWLVAAWWVVLPINYDAYYEVHLFALIPPLLATLLVLRADTALARGSALGVLLAATLLVRNELFIALAVLAAAGLACDVRRMRSRGGALRPSARRVALGYGLPLLLGCSAALLFYARSGASLPELRDALRYKQAMSMCQIYAFSYKQRHSDWQESEWTQCQDLMVRDFGAPFPTQIEAARLNPRAMLEHLRWNLRLIPNGLQVLLFNATSDTVNPDFISVPTGVRLVLPASLALLAILVAGSIVLVCQRRFWWRYWLAERAWGWICMLSVACTTLAVMIVQRPRPSYMFPIGVLLMACTGMAVYALGHRLALAHRLAATAPLWMLAALALSPTYVPYYTDGARGLIVGYRRLLPFAARLQSPSTVLVASAYGPWLCNYFSSGDGTACTGTDFAALGPAARDGASLSEALDRENASFAYVDERQWSDAGIAALAATPQAFGWKALEPRGERWLVLERMRRNGAAGDARN